MSTQTPETFQTFETFNAEAVPTYEAMPQMVMPEVAAPTYASMPEFDALPDAPQPAKAKKAKKNKNWFTRIFAFLLSIAFIAIYCLVPITHLKSDGSYIFEKTNYLEHMIGLFTKPMEGAGYLFGLSFLPTHFTQETLNTSVINQAITIIMYLLPVALVICFFFGIIALFSKKAAGFCLRFITATQFIFSALLMIALVLIAAWYDDGHTSWQDGLDIYLLAIAGASFFIYVIASIVKSKGWAVLDLFIFLLTAASVGGVAFGLISNPDITRDFLTAEGIYSTITFSLIGADMFFLICALIGISAKKLRGIDLVRSIFMTAVGAFLVVISLTNIAGADLSKLLLPSIIAAGSAFLMLIIEVITIAARNGKKKSKKAKKVKAEKKAEKKVKPAKKAKADKKAVAAVEPVAPEAPAQAFVTIDAPIAPAAPAVEEAPVVEEAPEMAMAVEAAPAEPAEPFDAFLVTLTKEEKEQFGALTLKLQKMADMPRFEAGADNKVFFRRIFVNLGTVRGMIADDLMEKIYQYTIQL